ncbi:DNA polymerase III subunit gamma/tau [Salmonella enterica subsp. enterica]
MSYQVLARKWRPQTFADVVGQEHVLTALANGLSLGRIHHAYLFSGTRGVGKTSIARLLAKGLNCETGITATPCGVCDNCREIEQGRFVDLIEIDAASRTKVEDTRDLLDNVQYAPARGRFKVYLIDEVHMLSRHSFNALLKTLEEPPAHVKFLLATTDPQKLPVTILSRCLQFHLKALDVEQIRHQLEHILNEEHIAHEPRALQLLSRAADGSLRDALSLTDQAIASGDGQVSTQAVSAMLGTLDDDQALSLVEAVVDANGERVMSLINEAAAQVSQLSLPKLVEQVALNAWKEQNGNAVCLHLRSTQRHLNSSGAQQKLAQALSDLTGTTVELTIVEDDNPAVRTPLEWRQAIYEEKLAQARESIIADNNIQTLRRFFDAELDEESIRPI